MEKKKSAPANNLKRAKSPKKVVPKKKTKGSDKEKAGRAAYSYTKLDQFLDKPKDRVNFYAVVLDSSAPYYSTELKKYLCTMKLMDESVFPKAGAQKKAAFMSMTVFANAKDLIPTPAKVGTILRIHRADVKKYKGENQLVCDVNIKGAWVMFDAAEGVAPIGQSGKSFTFTEDDKKTLKDVRKFAQKFFKDYDLSALSAVKDKKDEFDAVGIVLNRATKGKVEELTVCDGKEFYELKVPAMAFSSVMPLDVVYVRGIGKKGGKFTLSEYSNILKVPKEYGTAGKLMKDIEKKKKTGKFKEKLGLYSSF